MIVIRSPRNFWLGMIYLAVGLVGLWFASKMALGSASRMGAGYFPAIVSVLLAGFGAVSVLRSLLVEGEAVGSFSIRGPILVVASIVAFGLLFQTMGFVVAIVVLAVMSAAASRDFALDTKSVFGLAGLVIFCVLVFIKALGVPMQLVGPWLEPVLPANLR